MKNVRSLAVLFSAVGVVSIAIAAPEEVASAPVSPLYIDLNLGASTTNSKEPAGLNALGATFSKGGFAINTNLGWKFNKNFATEIGFSHMRGNNLMLGASFFGILDGIGYSSSANVFDLAAKGILPLGSDVDIFAKLGPALVVTNESAGILLPFWGNADDSQTSTLAAYYAAGAEYNLSDDFGLNVQVSGVTNSKTNPAFAGSSGFSPPQNPALIMFSGGLEYRFG